MEKIFQNYGLSHIAIKIFGYLDYCSLCKARLTFRLWKDFIDTFCRPNRIQWRLTITFHSKEWFLELWPEWKNILSDFIQNRSSNDVKKLFAIVNYYFNQYPHMLKHRCCMLEGNAWKLVHHHHSSYDKPSFSAI